MNGLRLVCLSCLLVLASCSSSENSTDDNNSITDPNGVVSVGLHYGFTGPVESLAEPMALAAESAISEISESGEFLNGTTVTAVRADSTCTDTVAATTSFEELLMAEVSGVIGSTCSGVTGAMLTNVAVPAGMVMISPSSTAPSLSTIEDNGLFFRTAPSDTRQGELLSQVTLDRGIQTAAVTYTNNSYGQTLADEFNRAFEANGGAVTLSASHENGAADYADIVSTLSASGGEILLVAGYFDQGGTEIINQALSTGAYTRFVLPDGMVDQSLPDLVGAGLDGSFGLTPGNDGEGFSSFFELATDFDATSPFAAESYDAAALLLLAMQSANSSDPGEYKANVFDVANAPGEIIYAGELAKALRLLANGDDIDYFGATNIELIGTGDAIGTFREIEIQNGTTVTVGFR